MLGEFKILASVLFLKRLDHAVFTLVKSKLYGLTRKGILKTF